MTDKVFNYEIFKVLRARQNLTLSEQQDFATLVTADEAVENAQEQLKKAEEHRNSLLAQFQDQ